MPGTLQASHPYPPVPGILNPAGAAMAAYGMPPSVAVVMQLTYADVSAGHARMMMLGSEY
jgi:hypothetical protein